MNDLIGLTNDKPSEWGFFVTSGHLILHILGWFSHRPEGDRVLANSSSPNLVHFEEIAEKMGETADGTSMTSGHWPMPKVYEKI